MLGWIIAAAVVVVLGIGGWIGWSYIAKEHKQTLSLQLNALDFSHLQDGVYTGEYEGGLYKWRANTVEVTVSGGKVAGIRLLEAKFEYDEKEKLNALYDRVIAKQTLQVDAISGATLTSKGFLQAVENALLQAENGI